MARLPVHDTTGAQTGEAELPALFGDGPKTDALHQAILADLAAKRQGTAHTKTRGEVAGSGRKLWRQKGTGRARVGDRRPPNRIGGGRVTGPRMRSYRQRTAKRSKGEALRSALVAKVGAGEVTLMAPFELPEAKTRELSKILVAAGCASGALLLLGQPDEIIARCGRNIPNLQITYAAAVSSYDLMAARRVIITTDALPQLEARVS